jgi:hypothetical protein
MNVLTRTVALSLALPLAVLVACSTSSPPPTVAPTVQSVATQAAPTAQAVATQAAPTAQTAATQVAPTVQVVATAGAGMATQAPAAASTAVAGAPVRITEASLSASDPRITIQNTTNQPVDLSGWTLRVGETSARLPANTQAPAGQALVLHVQSGASSGRDVYLGQPAPDLMQALRPGARVALEDPSGSTITAVTVPGA